MELTLTAETGRITGSRSAGRLRADGLVPGTLYGLGLEPVSVAVKWPELRRALTTDAGTNAVIGLEVDGMHNLTIVKELQRDPVRREVLHVDFLRVDPDATVDIEVPIVLVGEASEVEAAKGIVEQHLMRLTVSVKPADIPDQIELDITDLDIGETITVGSLTLPAGATSTVDPEASVVAGVATRFSEEDLGGEAGEGEGGEAEGEGEGEGAAEAESAE